MLITTSSSDEHQRPIPISHQGAVDPTLVGQSGLASQRNRQSDNYQGQSDNYQGHTTENEVGTDPSTSSSQAVHQDHGHQHALVAASHQQQRLMGQANADPDRLALPSVHQGTSLHSVESTEEPMLSQAQFDDPIVLCEEVRVKIEELDTSELIQELIQYLKRK